MLTSCPVLKPYVRNPKDELGEGLLPPPLFLNVDILKNSPFSTFYSHYLFNCLLKKDA